MMKTKAADARGAAAELRPDLAKTLESEQIAAARARLARLQADLADARIAADAATAQHQAAERAWNRAEDAGVPHTQEQAEQLTRLGREASAAKAAVTALREQIAQAEWTIAQDAEVAARQRRIALAEALWPPMVKRLMPQVRQMLAALEEQERVKAQLVEAGAWGLVSVEDLALPGAMYDDQCPAMRQWLAQAERAGFRA